MLWKKKVPKVKLTTIEKIQQSSIEELLKSCEYPSFSLNIEEAQEVFKKCEKPLDFVMLYFNAFQTSQDHDFNINPVVMNEVLSLIYLEVCRVISSVIKDNSRITNGKITLLKELHSYLGPAWKSKPNSPERIFLQKKLEVEWRKLAREIYSTIQEKGSTDPLDYEKLFHLCKQDDPLVLEIAEKINSL